jgi:hypothetical protein
VSDFETFIGEMESALCEIRIDAANARDAAQQSIDRCRALQETIASVRREWLREQIAKLQEANA